MKRCRTMITVTMTCGTLVLATSTSAQPLSSKTEMQKAYEQARKTIETSKFLNVPLTGLTYQGKELNLALSMRGHPVGQIQKTLLNYLERMNTFSKSNKKPEYVTTWDSNDNGVTFSVKNTRKNSRWSLAMGKDGIALDIAGHPLAIKAEQGGRVTVTALERIMEGSFTGCYHLTSITYEKKSETPQKQSYSVSALARDGELLIPLPKRQKFDSAYQ